MEADPRVYRRACIAAAVRDGRSGYRVSWTVPDPRGTTRRRWCYRWFATRAEAEHLQGAIVAAHWRMRAPAVAEGEVTTAREREAFFADIGRPPDAP